MPIGPPATRPHRALDLRCPYCQAKLKAPAPATRPERLSLRCPRCREPFRVDVEATELRYCYRGVLAGRVTFLEERVPLEEPAASAPPSAAKAPTPGAGARAPSAVASSARAPRVGPLESNEPDPAVEPGARGWSLLWPLLGLLVVVVLAVLASSRQAGRGWARADDVPVEPGPVSPDEPEQRGRLSPDEVARLLAADVTPPPAPDVTPPNPPRPGPARLPTTAVVPVPASEIVVDVTSDPAGATVARGGQELGVTPLQVRLPRSDQMITLRVLKEGFEAVDVRFVGVSDRSFRLPLKAVRRR